MAVQLRAGQKISWTRALSSDRVPLTPLPGISAKRVGGATWCIFTPCEGEDVTSRCSDQVEAAREVREALGGWESCDIGSRLLLARQSRADIA